MERELNEGPLGARSPSGQPPPTNHSACFLSSPSSLSRTPPTALQFLSICLTSYSTRLQCLQHDHHQGKPVGNLLRCMPTAPRTHHPTPPPNLSHCPTTRMDLHARDKLWSASLLGSALSKRPGHPSPRPRRSSRYPPTRTSPRRRGRDLPRKLTGGLRRLKRCVDGPSHPRVSR